MARRLIHTKVTFSMLTGEVIEDECHVYDGPVDECGGGKGGGSSTVNSVDYEYNARMAALSEEQQDWAREYYKVWQDYYKPYEIAQAQANMQNLGAENSLYRNSLQQAASILPQQAKVTSEYLNQARRGVDINERVGQAAADAANTWADVGASTARANARMGVNPNSGRYQGILASLDTQKAAQIAGARTQARTAAEEENYQRLKDASGANTTSGILSTIQALKG